MLYVEENATLIAKMWKVAPSTVSRWKRMGSIPDKYIARLPIDNAGRGVEQKLLELVEAGWLKARPISRIIGHPDKINALLSARRHPDDSRYHVNNLDGDEVEKIRKLLHSIQHSLGGLFYLASTTPAGRLYNESIQVGLRALLKRKEIDTANIRASMDKKQVARFWSFIYGRQATREDLDIVLSQLKIFLELLS
ncbi:hypothetical protein GO755_40085 [Spirosoma sp. HMF4905]|uniref:Uncharacterized protein n=1 Tax=Spirosoma arboris TaxID=2682092 RepID=A0A7K1SR66_9BACT|nr:hypothetical protein [Spirosoma arboris]MVM36277.1 hypothetical protein [Spirosoma arboris]